MSELKKEPNSRERRAARRERRAKGLTGPATTPPKIRRITHGEVPDPALGWVADKPTDDPMFRIARITTIRWDDGNIQRFYLMLLRTEELERKRELAKKKLKEIRRENREAKKKEAKQRKRQVRLVLAMLGRS